MDVLFGGGGGDGGGGRATRAARVVAAAKRVATRASSAVIASASAILVSGGTAAATATTTANQQQLATSSASSSSSEAIYSLASSSHSATTAAATAAAAAEAAASLLVNPAHFNGHDNGPILYTDSNRTSAIDDIRSVVIYIFIVTIFLCFFLILPGIRSEKLPTFFCITTSLLVGSIIVLSLFGTTWHVGEAPISAAYKAFSRDRIQGDLKVRIGLQSVNISLKAHKYYILHHADGPMIMENMPPLNMLAQMTSSSASSSQSSPGNPQASASSNHVVGTEAAKPNANNDDDDGDDDLEVSELEYATSDQSTSAAAASFIRDHRDTANDSAPSLTDELLAGRTADGIPVDTELETDEVFPNAPDTPLASRGRRASEQRKQKATTTTTTRHKSATRNKRQQEVSGVRFGNQTTQATSANLVPKYTIKRVHVDINYNERFYWIGPVQMRHEYHQALERGLPYPILTVVEYLSQDEAGFNWSRRYRAAGYYASMCLWLSASLCVLMFCLHCAAPRYGIYTMQLLGCLLLFTNLTYAVLVPRGDQKLVIPFEGQSLTFRFGWNFWLVLVGGCLSLLVGTIIVILDNLFPNFILTTVLDADFDSQQTYYQRKHKTVLHADRAQESDSPQASPRQHEKPKLPPFMKRKSPSSSLRKTPDANIQDNNKLSRKSQHASGNQPDESSQELNKSSRTTSSHLKQVPLSENNKLSDGSGMNESLRRRSEHQMTAISRTSHQDSRPIDYRDLDLRESELSIRL